VDSNIIFKHLTTVSVTELLNNIKRFVLYFGNKVIALRINEAFLFNDV